MSVSWKKTTIAAGAALAVGLSLATPASAQWRGGGWGYGPAVGLGVLGGVALGAAAANAANGPYYDRECWLERRPVYDEDGNFIGRRRMRVCR